MTSQGSKSLDVFFYEAFEEEAAELTSLLGKTCSFDCSTKTIQELGHAQPPAPLISIRTQSKVPPEWSDSIGGVLSRSTGYDHLIAYGAIIKKPLPLGYLDEYATRAVAEQAILLAFALLRKLPAQTRNFSTFERDGLTGTECRGKNFLVVGVGRIGSEICAIAKSLGFIVKGVDIVRNKPGVDYISKDEGVRWADVIACSMNLTQENRHYFDYSLLKNAKTGSLFVNIARGELSPVRDLTTLLGEKRLGGVGLDVYEDESVLGVALRNPQASTSPVVKEIRSLAEFPNVILTPHNAFNTMEAVKRKAQMSVEQIRHFLKHKDFIWKLQ
jgi:D-lactate dehydrogenase